MSIRPYIIPAYAPIHSCISHTIYYILQTIQTVTLSIYLLKYLKILYSFLKYFLIEFIFKILYLDLDSVSNDYFKIFKKGK